MNLFNLSTHISPCWRGMDGVEWQRTLIDWDRRSNLISFCQLLQYINSQPTRSSYNWMDKTVFSFIFFPFQIGSWIYQKLIQYPESEFVIKMSYVWKTKWKLLTIRFSCSSYQHNFTELSCSSSYLCEF